jgi:hypothetical protein
MNKIAVLAIAGLLASTGGVAFAAKGRPNLTARTAPAAHKLTVTPNGTVLFDQTTDDSGIGIVSQTFESTYSVYDSQGADDFVVPSGKTWTVSEVDVYGQYFNGSGPAASENVTFYKDKKGHPGKVVKTFTGLKGTDSSGSFKITLPKKGVKLKAGTYWVAVNANLAFSAGGEWGWDSTATAGTGSAADWENPAGGFGIGCTTYTTETTCIPDGQGPGKVFAIVGTAK